MGIWHNLGLCAVKEQRRRTEKSTHTWIPGTSGGIVFPPLYKGDNEQL